MQWPEDPAGFFNAMDVLMRMERWEEAGRVFELLPECALKLKFYEERKQQLQARDLSAGENVKINEFYGQPDLGGMLIEASNYN